MERESAKAIANSKKEPFFRAYDLNQNALREDSEPLLTTSELTKLFTRQPLAADGDYVLGVDAGATRAWSSSAVALWPATGRVAAFLFSSRYPWPERASGTRPATCRRLRATSPPWRVDAGCCRSHAALVGAS